MTELERLKQRSRKLHLKMVKLKIKLEDLDKNTTKNRLIKSLEFGSISSDYCSIMLKKDKIDKQILD